MNRERRRINLKLPAAAQRDVTPPAEERFMLGWRINSFITEGCDHTPEVSAGIRKWQRRVHLLLTCATFEGRKLQFVLLMFKLWALLLQLFHLVSSNFTDLSFGLKSAAVVLERWMHPALQKHKCKHKFPAQTSPAEEWNVVFGLFPCCAPTCWVCWAQEPCCWSKLRLRSCRCSLAASGRNYNTTQRKHNQSRQTCSQGAKFPAQLRHRGETFCSKPPDIFIMIQKEEFKPLQTVSLPACP